MFYKSYIITKMTKFYLVSGRHCNAIHKIPDFIIGLNKNWKSKTYTLKVLVIPATWRRLHTI